MEPMTDSPSNTRPLIPDVLASRYASGPMREVWSPEGRVVLERELWIAVLKAQAALGVAVPRGAIADYERVRERVDLAAIEVRERALRHDVKARIEAFNALAGHEHIHKGMTSRDLTDNVEQLQVRRSLELLRGKTVTALLGLADLAQRHRETVIVARTHDVPAQPTTFGKRLAMFGEELLRGLHRLLEVLESYPLRGLKGAVGTQLDQISLLAGDVTAALALEQKLAAELGSAPGVRRAEVAGGGYVNLFLDRGAFARQFHGSLTRPTSPSGARGHVIVEHTSINPNKAAHVGHLLAGITPDGRRRAGGEGGRPVAALAGQGHHRTKHVRPARIVGREKQMGHGPFQPPRWWSRSAGRFSTTLWKAPATSSRSASVIGGRMSSWVITVPCAVSALGHRPGR